MADAISNKTLKECGFQVAKKEPGSDQGPRTPFLSVLGSSAGSSSLDQSS